MVTGDYCDLAIYLGMAADVLGHLIIGLAVIYAVCMIAKWHNSWLGPFRWNVQIDGKNCRVVRQNLTGRGRFQFSKPVLVDFAAGHR